MKKTGNKLLRKKTYTVIQPSPVHAAAVSVPSMPITEVVVQSVAPPPKSECLPVLNEGGRVAQR